jgi:hypothetical protein
LPRGALVSHGPFGFAFGFAVGRLQDYACEFRDFQEPGTYAIGFRFNNGAGKQYGWVRIKWGGCSANKYIVKDYAWGDRGDQVTVCQMTLDEPATPVARPQDAAGADAAPPADAFGSLGLLALGAVGLQAWRAKRAK